STTMTRLRPRTGVSAGGSWERMNPCGTAGSKRSPARESLSPSGWSARSPCTKVRLPRSGTRTSPLLWIRRGMTMSLKRKSPVVKAAIASPTVKRPTLQRGGRLGSGSGGCEGLTSRSPPPSSGGADFRARAPFLAARAFCSVPSGAAGQDAEPRTGSIDQHPIEGHREGVVSPVAVHHVHAVRREALDRALEGRDARLVALHRPHLALVAHQFGEMGALAAGGRAQV